MRQGDRRQLARIMGPWVLAIVCQWAGLAGALGTLAGTEITSQAMVTYTIGADPGMILSNQVVIPVAQLLDVSVIWQDAAPVQVAPQDSLRVLTYLVTNSGNGPDTFSLTGLDAIAGDDFDPSLVGLRLDANGNGTYEEAVDPWYLPGANDPFLEPSTPLAVFLVSNIPAAVADGQQGSCRLEAVSRTGSGEPGSVLPGAGVGGVDAVVGTSGAAAADLGTYQVINIQVQVLKSATVTRPTGGTEPAPGAVITYSLIVMVSGTGTAQDVTITDPFPAHTTYVPHSLTLNAVSLSDEADADAGTVVAGPPGQISVQLGDLTAAAPEQTITFAVVID